MDENNKGIQKTDSWGHIGVLAGISAVLLGVHECQHREIVKEAASSAIATPTPIPAKAPLASKHLVK
jgi:hypothetical protein